MQMDHVASGHIISGGVEGTKSANRVSAQPVHKGRDATIHPGKYTSYQDPHTKIYSQHHNQHCLSYF